MNVPEKQNAGPLGAGEPEKKLTREQQRIVERVEKEAFQTLKMLSDRFFNFFMESDNPEGPEVEAKRIQLSAQWKAYCHRKGLTKAAREAFDMDAKIVLKNYQEAKEKIPVPLPDPEHVQIADPISDVETASPAY